MAPLTDYLGMSYPSENDDPYFEGIQNFFTQVDRNIFALMEISGQPMLGGGTLNFITSPSPPYTGLLTWTEDFELPILASGFFVKASFGPDLATRHIDLVDGDRVILVAQTISGADVVTHIDKINGAVNIANTPGLPALFTLAFYRTGRLYLNLPRSLP